MSHATRKQGTGPILTNYDIDAVFVGHDGELEITAELRIRDAKITISHYGPESNRARTICAQKPAAIAFVDTLAAELLGGAIVPHARKREPAELDAPTEELPAASQPTQGADA